jgi:hypothetical protein
MLYLKEFLVGTTGEPLRNEINSLQKCEGEVGALKRNGYFERSPHQKGRRPGHAGGQVLPWRSAQACLCMTQKWPLVRYGLNNESVDSLAALERHNSSACC